MNTERISKYIDSHKEEMIDVLKTLVSYPSVQNPPLPNMPFGKPCAEVLEKALEIAGDFGFKTKNLENYAGTITFDEREAKLGILCHLDVVPEGEGWTYGPYNMTVEGNKLIGRGTIDDKGPAVAVLYAMKAIKDLGIELKENVRFIIGTNEENGSADMEYYKKCEAMPPMLFTPDGNYPVINIEKGMIRACTYATFKNENAEKKILSIKGGTVVNAVPQSCEAVIQGFTLSEVKSFIEGFKSTLELSAKEENGKTVIFAQGKGAHASTPSEGDNAITGMVKFLSAMPFDSTDAFTKLKNLGKCFPYNEYNGESAGVKCSDKKSGSLTLVLSIIDFNEQGFNASIDIRFPVCATSGEITSKLINTLNSANLDAKILMSSEPHCVDEESEFVQTLLKVYEKMTGQKGECIAIGGGTYVHDTEGGVAFGAEFPGDNNNMHGLDEFITIDSLLLNAKIFAEAILQICG